MERCLFWGSAVVLRGSAYSRFCGEVVYFWGKYSGFREKWSYSGEVVSLLRGGVVVSEDVGRCVPPYKDDRTMRPIYGYPKNFREYLSTPTTTFPEIFNGHLFRSILCVENLKFIALPVPVIVGVSKKLGSPWICPCNALAKFEVRT